VFGIGGVVVRYGRDGRPGKGTVCSRSAGVLPFRFRREAVHVPVCGWKPFVENFTIFVGVEPRGLFDGKLWRLPSAWIFSDQLLVLFLSYFELSQPETSGDRGESLCFVGEATKFAMQAFAPLYFTGRETCVVIP